VLQTTRPTLLAGAAVLAVLLLAGCGGGDDKKAHGKEAAGARQTVTAATVTQINLARTVSASGSVSAWE